MAKGSIRFDSGINVEVAVDPSQAEGAKLLNAVNLADGQELSGGGNPNSVQVIEGNGANPWGDVSPRDLYEAILSGNANAKLLMSSEYGVFNQNILAILDDLRVEGCLVNGAVAQGYTARWASNSGALSVLKQISIEDGSGSIIDLKNFASNISTTLTIYWHPMPETEGE